MPHVANAADGTAAPRRSASKGLCAFFQRKGVTNIELFGHAGFPANTDIAGLTALPRAARQVRPARRRLARHRERRRPGVDRRASTRPRSSAPTTSARAASPPRASAATPTRCAPPQTSTARQELRRGRRRPRLHPQPHAVSSTRKYVDNGVLQVRVADHHGAHRRPLRAAEIDVFWSSDAFGDVTGTRRAALINASSRPASRCCTSRTASTSTRQPSPHRTAARLAARLPAPARSTSGRSSPPRREPRPVLPPRARRRHDHRRRHSFTNLKGIGTAVVRRCPRPPADVPVGRRRHRRPPRTPSRSDHPEHRRRAADHHDCTIGQRSTRRRRRRLLGRQQNLHRHSRDRRRRVTRHRRPRPSRAAPAPSTSASSRPAPTTRRSRACRSPRTPTPRPSRSCWPAEHRRRRSAASAARRRRARR